MAAEQEYTAVVYSTTSGRVLYDIDLAGDPDWSAKINEEGDWSVPIPLRGGESTVRLHEWIIPYRYSVAIILGSTVCQAGPILPYDPSSNESTIAVKGKGFWELMNRRVLHNRLWDPSSKRITDSSADITFTDLLANIARQIVEQSTLWAFRPGSALPLDLPPYIAGGGPNVRTYHGYEMASAGQRLKELTQVDGGPDVYFQPYMTTVGGTRFVRHRMLIGQPFLVQPGVPLLFDYRSSLVSLGIQGGGTTPAITAFVKGTGNEAGQLYGYATATALTDAGWPALDMVDTNHTDAALQPTLDGWAAADVARYGVQPELWQATVKASYDPDISTYIPGHFANYSVKNHHWLPDGIYNWRIVGLSHSGSSDRNTVDHQLQAARSF
ncbi:hypothetical protein QMK34_05465 [Amycolatopsis sp. H20-H5]|nr:hypothetical protein [Amycolatopsis sp. H20-H5]